VALVVSAVPALLVALIPPRPEYRLTPLRSRISRRSRGLTGVS